MDSKQKADAVTLWQSWSQGGPADRKDSFLESHQEWRHNTACTKLHLNLDFQFDRLAM